MKRTEDKTNTTQHHSITSSPSAPHNLQQNASLLLSELSPQLRGEAEKFVDFTNKVLGRLYSIGTRVCRRYLEELRYCPESYDQLPGYHVDLLAREIGYELDALYGCLKANTMDVISISYAQWIRKNSREEHHSPHSSS